MSGTCGDSWVCSQSGPDASCVAGGRWHGREERQVAPGSGRRDNGSSRNHRLHLVCLEDFAGLLREAKEEDYAGACQEASDIYKVLIPAVCHLPACLIVALCWLPWSLASLPLRRGFAMLQGLAGYFFPLITFSTRNSSSSCLGACVSSWVHHGACFDHLLSSSYHRPPMSPQTQSPVLSLPAQPYFIFKRGLKDSLQGQQRGETNILPPYTCRFPPAPAQQHLAVLGLREHQTVVTPQ